VDNQQSSKGNLVINDDAYCIRPANFPKINFNMVNDLASDIQDLLESVLSGISRLNYRLALTILL